MEKTKGFSVAVYDGCNTLICEEECQSTPSLYEPHLNEVFTYGGKPWWFHRAAAVSLAVLAALLLIVNIGLGIHYNQLTDTHLTVEDTQEITKELTDLHHTYHQAMDQMKDSEKQTMAEMTQQIQTTWEFDHHTSSGNDYTVKMDKLKKDVDAMKHHLPMIYNGCRHCPTGWVFKDSSCYYFESFRSSESRTWNGARSFCQLQGGDLIIIDSTEKQNATVNYLLNTLVDLDILAGFWIGLKDMDNGGDWRWVNGAPLYEGFWLANRNKGCAVLNVKENFYKSWEPSPCSNKMKWICEKKNPTTT